MNRTPFILTKFALVGSLGLGVGCDPEADQESEAERVEEAPAGGDPKTAPKLEAVRVEVAAVGTSKASFKIVRPGEVEPKRDASVASAMGGLVESVVVRTGDVVRTGAVLARVDASLFYAQRDLAQVEVDEAERELKRLESMGAAVASSRVDQAKTRVARGQAQLRIAQIQTGRTVVKAPFAGVVAAVGVEKGEVAPPGALIARLVEIDPAVVSVAVADRDVGSLTKGMSASVTAGGSDFVGSITRIEPTASLKTRAFMAEVEIDNPQGALRPGMIATVEFSSNEGEDKILLPQELIVTKLDANGVFVVEGETARWRPLVLGELVRDQITIESGLLVGDRVVVLGHRGLADGDPLIIERSGRCCVAGRVVFGPAMNASAPASLPADVGDAPPPAGPDVGDAPVGTLGHDPGKAAG